MSAYVVSYETLNKILAGVEYTKWKHFDYPQAPRGMIGKEYGPEFEPEALTKLGDELLSLNVKAIQCRYEDMRPKTPSEVVDFWLPGNEGAEFAYNPSTVSPKPIPLYKALKCFLYQCAEGTVVHDPLFKAMDEWATGMAHEIVSRLDEYEKAVWG